MPGDEVARLYGIVGADISSYVQALDRAEQRARQAQQQIGAALGHIQLGTPAGWERAGGLLLPAGAAQQVQEVGAAMAETTASSDRLAGALRTVGSVFGLTFSAYAVRQVGDIAWQMAQLGAQAERLERGFTALAGANAADMIDRLRVASRGAVSDMALMQAANRAMMLGVTRNADEMVRLMEVARARGAAMGLSTQQAFDDLVTGIGRVSPLILDNLGILTGGQQGFEAYAKSIGKTADELTDVEKRHYLLQKVLNDTQTQMLAQASAVEDAATGFERLQAGLENYRAALGRSMAAGLAPVAGGLGAFLGSQAELINTTRTLGEELARYGQELERANRTGAMSAQTHAAVERAYLGLVNAYRSGALTVGELHSAQQRLLEQFPELAAAMGILADAAWRDELSWRAAREEARLFREEIQRLKKEAATGPVMTEDMVRAEWEYNFAIADRARQVEMLQQKLEGMPSLQELIAKGDEKAVREYYRTKTDLARLQKDIQEDQLRESEKWAREYQRQVERQQQELRSLVEGILKPTQVTDLDMARTRLGLYQDQWDEYIRRLRAAASDAQSQWRHLIPTDILQQGADAIRVWLAETEEAFYAGQLPEMIDWDAFDRALQDQIAKQQAREALIQTAMQRAAGKASKEQVIAALGLPITPSEAITMDLAGVGSQVQLGKPITDAFEKQLAAESERWKALGAAAMQWFSSGALAGVNPQVGAEIARKLWPYFASLLPEERP